MIFFLYHLFVDSVLTDTDFFIPLVTHGFNLSFSSFFVNSFIGACFSKIALNNRRKASKPRFTSLFCVAKAQSMYCKSILKDSMSKLLKSLYVVLAVLLVGLSPLPFSIMMNWGRRSDIDVVIFPKLYLSVWPFKKILSISVAVFLVILVGSVISGVKLWLKSCSKNSYVPLIVVD